jgi:N-acetylneuraminate synthase
MSVVCEGEWSKVSIPPGLRIGDRTVGAGQPAFIVAEMSANHGQDFDRAVQMVNAAKESGADAVKLQTYTPDTMTIPSNKEWFRIPRGTSWEGRTLYDLYGEAYTPWEWHPRLMEIARDAGLPVFSTPFDKTAVAFLEELEVPAYKVASFELVDLPLLREVGRTRKPVILSTGMATVSEIQEAIDTLRSEGAEQLALLVCTSSYPAPTDQMNLRRIPHLSERFDLSVGLSDHSMSWEVPVVAVALGACIIEKHFTLSRADDGPDSAFSLEPSEFAEMVVAVRTAESALGTEAPGVAEGEEPSRIFRRSLFVVRPMTAGEEFSAENVRSIRPGYGLHTRHMEEVIGRPAACDIEAGSPLSWDLVK